MFIHSCLQLLVCVWNEDQKASTSGGSPRVPLTAMINSRSVFQVSFDFYRIAKSPDILYITSTASAPRTTFICFIFVNCRHKSWPGFVFSGFHRRLYQSTPKCPLLCLWRKPDSDEFGFFPFIIRTPLDSSYSIWRAILYRQHKETSE